MICLIWLQKLFWSKNVCHCVNWQFSSECASLLLHYYFQLAGKTLWPVTGLFTQNINWAIMLHWTLVWQTAQSWPVNSLFTQNINRAVMLHWTLVWQTAQHPLCPEIWVKPARGARNHELFVLDTSVPYCSNAYLFMKRWFWTQVCLTAVTPTCSWNAGFGRKCALLQ